MTRRGARVGAVVLALSALGCGSATPAAQPTEAGPAPAPLEPCALAGGGILLRIPRPAGFAVARSPEACMVAEEGSELPFFYTVTAAAADDERAAALDAPGGLRAWAARSDLFEEPPRAVGEQELVVSGQSVQAVRLVGRPAGLSVPREVLAAVLRRGSLRIVVMAIYDPQDEGDRQRARSLLQAIQWEQPK